MSDKSGRHVRIYACAQRDMLLNQLHVSASTKLGIKVSGTVFVPLMVSWHKVMSKAKESSAGTMSIQSPNQHRLAGLPGHVKLTW